MTDNDLKTKAATTNESLARWFSVFALSGALSLGGFAGSVASAQSAEEHQTYNKPIVIRPGDTLSHIALRELGSEKRAQELAEANGLKLEQILKPGDSINIPVTLPVRDEFATLIFSKVRVTINGEVAKPNEQVRRNDILETDRSGYASLEFSTGSVINLQPNTLARIVTLHCQPNDDTCIIEMAAERGTLSADVQSEDGRSTDFRVQTPYASAAVRGTSFDVDSNSTGLRVGVTDGAVALGAANSDQVVELDAGFGSVAAPGTPLSGPIALLPAPVFRFVPPRITQNDLVRWFTLTDVNQYIVQIAEQPSGVGVIAETSVNSDIFRLNEDIPAGDYHLLLRPVDENGLLGFTATSPVTINRQCGTRKRNLSHRNCARSG